MCIKGGGGGGGGFEGTQIRSIGVRYAGVRCACASSAGVRYSGMQM